MFLSEFLYSMYVLSIKYILPLSHVQMERMLQAVCEAL
jgi:hypothetical protein